MLCTVAEGPRGYDEDVDTSDWLASAILDYYTTIVLQRASGHFIEIGSLDPAQPHPGSSTNLPSYTKYNI